MPWRGGDFSWPDLCFRPVEYRRTSSPSVEKFSENRMSPLQSNGSLKMSKVQLIFIRRQGMPEQPSIQAENCPRGEAGSNS